MSALRSVWRGAAIAGAIALLGAVPCTAAVAADTPSGWAGDAACVECHQEKATALPIHSALQGQSSGPRLQCETCHGSGVAHVQDPGSAGMLDPRTAPAADANRACLQCHSLSNEVDGIQHQHVRAGLRCAECHAAHGPGIEPHLLQKPVVETCIACHGDVAAELHHVSHHPVRDGRLTCATCHMPDIEATGVRAPRGINNLCVSCHAEHDAVAPFEHPIATEFTVEGEGCTVCHAPHGSPQPRLLRRPGDALCLQCHMPPPGHRTAHGGIYAGLRCLDCHTDIHGSFTNRALLSPHPLGEDCLTCHGH
jgi:DmsE family decaheme c-type cytochrome